MDVKKFFIEYKWVFIHLALAVIFVLVIIFGTKLFLNLVTQHNKEKTVPDFTSMTFDQAVKAADEAGIEVAIVDSVYIKRMAKGTVYSQYPKAGSKVKAGRTIDLTTNAVSPKKVAMPLLIGFSMRQAKAELTARGLFLGKLTYVSDMATNNVLKQKFNGRDIAAGKMIDSGSMIDLTLGLSPEENRTFVPNVIGLKYQYAVDAVLNSSLNVGRLHFDKGIHNYTDSLNAVVYKQQPANGSGSITMGSSVTMYLKKADQQAAE